MEVSYLEIADFITTTILTICSLAIAVIALIISLKTYRLERLPIIGVCFREQEDNIYIEIANHGSGVAMNVNINCRICDIEYHRALNHLPPNTTVSVRLLSTTAWGQIIPQEQQIICSYSYSDKFNKQYSVQDVDLLFR